MIKLYAIFYKNVKRIMTDNEINYKEKGKLLNDSRENTIAIFYVSFLAVYRIYIYIYRCKNTCLLI